MENQQTQRVTVKFSKSEVRRIMSEFDEESRFQGKCNVMNEMILSGMLSVSIVLNGYSYRVKFMAPHGIRQVKLWMTDKGSNVIETSVPRFTVLNLQMEEFKFGPQY